MKTVSVINQKGGVGKTTTCINLSACLALRGLKVLLIDLDPQAHSTSGLGIELEHGQPAMSDMFEHGMKMDNIIIETKVKDLYLAPSRLRLDMTEMLISTANFKESILHKALRGLNYSFVIIDCRPSVGTLTVNALYASQYLIIPCEMSKYSLDGFSDLMDTIEAIQNNDNSGSIKVLRILLTKFESKNTVTNEWVFQQLEPFRDIMFSARIRKNEALNQASIIGEPIFFAKPNSNGAEDYNRLADEFLKLCDH